jgi:RNA polymerase sigma-70 factor (ECF subfamily)
LNNNRLHNIKELFIRIAEGDGAAFTELFRNYFEQVKWNALKILKSEFWAEEIVQEVFMQVWANREKLPEIESPAAYLFKITANRCIDRIRRQDLEIKMQYLVSRALHKETNAFQENLYDLDLTEKLIREAIRQLPEQGRRVFELHRNEGLSYQEISNRLNITSNTVRNHMVKDLHFIRSYLREKGQSYLLLFSIWYFF